MKKPSRLFKWFAASAVLFQAANCRLDVIDPNVAAGLREGIVTATTGIVETIIDALLDQSAADAAGNDMFIGI